MKKYIQYACCVLLVMSAPAPAASDPVVYVFDAAMDTTSLTAATEIVLEVSSQLTEETTFSIVIYDDVIQKVIPLGNMSAERLALIKQTLDDASRVERSNLAAGIERAVDELSGHGKGHIIVFGMAEIGTENADKKTQYLQWYANVLLPDAAERNLKLSFVTEADPQLNQPLELARSYQNVAIIKLQPSSEASAALISLLHPQTDTASPAPVDPLPAASGEFSPGDDSASLTGPQLSTTSADAPVEALAAAEPPATEVAETGLVDNIATVSAEAILPGPELTDDPGIELLGSQALSDRSLLHIIWYACFALALLALGIWLLYTHKKRSAADGQANPTGINPTTSAYLPLTEAPSRRFEALADAIDDIDPYEQWTAEPRTVRQIDPSPHDDITTDQSRRNTAKSQQQQIAEVSLGSPPKSSKPDQTPR